MKKYGVQSLIAKYYYFAGTFTMLPVRITLLSNVVEKWPLIRLFTLDVIINHP